MKNGRGQDAPKLGDTSAPHILELFLNKRERNSTVQHRRQSHRPQSSLCDCGSHEPKCCSASCRQSPARQRCGPDSRRSWQPLAPRSGAAVDFFALARLLRWPLNLIATIVCLPPERTSIDQNLARCTPVQLRQQCLFAPAVLRMMPPQRTSEQDNQRVRESHDRVLQPLPLCCPLSCARWVASSCERR